MGTGGGSCPTTTAPRDTHGHTISCAQVSPAALCRKSSLRSPTLPRASRPLPSQPPSSAEALAIKAMLHSPAPHPNLSLGRGTAPPASQEVLGAQEATWRILLPVQREKRKRRNRFFGILLLSEQAIHAQAQPTACSLFSALSPLLAQLQGSTKALRVQFTQKAREGEIPSHAGSPSTSLGAAALTWARRGHPACLRGTGCSPSQGIRAG